MSEELPENSITIVLSLDAENEEMSLASASCLRPDLDEDQKKALTDIYNGICLILDGGIDYLRFVGSIVTQLEDRMGNECEVEFEPDEELLEAVSEQKIIKFPRKLH